MLSIEDHQRKRIAQHATNIDCLLVVVHGVRNATSGFVLRCSIQILLLDTAQRVENIALVNLRDQTVATVSLEAVDRSRGIPPIQEAWAYPVP